MNTTNYTITAIVLVYEKHYSLEFASPTILSILRSSLNLSNTLPLRASCLSCSAPPFVTMPQHSMTSGFILLVFERQGLPNVVQEKVWPWSKLAGRNSPKWLTRPPKPIPFGMLSELKFTAHCQTCMQQNKILNVDYNGRPPFQTIQLRVDNYPLKIAVCSSRPE